MPGYHHLCMIHSSSLARRRSLAKIETVGNNLLPGEQVLWRLAGRNLGS